MNILITLCARGGSKGIPGKNIKSINGKPLIAYSIAFANELSKRLKYNVKIELSTDSDEIKKVASQNGLTTTYHRPDELATDNAGKIGVLNHLLNYSEKEYQCKFDYLIDLDITAPLRTLDDVLEALAKMKQNSQAINLFSVSKAHRNPYFNMVEEKENGFYALSKPSSGFLTRQSAPKVYDMNASFYIYKRKFFIEGFETAITSHSMIQLIDHLCFDLDEPIDFLFMEWLITHNRLDFELINP
jgi:CMP-N,N'-diacetyllegionaminic acid synthase